MLLGIVDFAMQPSIVVDSGGGYQVLWKHADPTPINGDARLAAQVETYNRALARHLDGDIACANVDRLLRLPGTINFPNEKKRKLGRVPALSRLVECHV